MPVQVLPPVSQQWPAGLDQRAAIDMATLRPARPIEHGTLYAYKKFDCRCDACSQAARDYGASRRRIQKAVRRNGRVNPPLRGAPKSEVWGRACYICGAPAMCGHREQELIEVWKR